MPMFVIAEMLGVSPDDYAKFRRWSDAIVEAGAGKIGEKDRRDRRGAACLRGRCPPTSVGVHPRDDLISLLVSSEIDGERLSDPEIGMFCLTLLVAGNETTRNLVAGGSPRPRAKPGSAGQAARQPGPVDELDRRDAPLRVAGPELRPLRDRGHRVARQEGARGRLPRVLLWVGQSR